MCFECFDSNAQCRIHDVNSTLKVQIFSRVAQWVLPTRLSLNICLSLFIIASG